MVPIIATNLLTQDGFDVWTFVGGNNMPIGYRTALTPPLRFQHFRTAAILCATELEQQLQAPAKVNS
jgi:hypothetical protein